MPAPCPTLGLLLLLMMPAAAVALVADNDTLRAVEQEPVTLTLTATNSDSIALTWTIVEAPAHGTLTYAADPVLYPSHRNRLIFTAHAGYYGPDRLRFTASLGAEVSNVATVNISIERNTPPVLLGGSCWINADPTGTVVKGGGPGRFTDPDPGQRYTFELTGAPAHGGTSRWTPLRVAAAMPAWRFSSSRCGGPRAPPPRPPGARG